MPLKAPPDDSAAVHIRGIPRETFFASKWQPLQRRRLSETCYSKLIEDKIQELEKKGLLPKGEVKRAGNYREVSV